VTCGCAGPTHLPYRAYLLECASADAADPFWEAIGDHLEAVRQAAQGRKGRKGKRARVARIWSSITGSTPAGQ
jgi:hypothetical protein